MDDWWLHGVRHALRVEHQVGRVMLLLLVLLEMDVHAQIVNRRLADSTVHAVERRLVREMMRWEGLLLLLHVERVDVLERRLLHLLRDVGVEAMEGSGLLASMQGAFRGWHGERCAQTAEVRRVQVAGLVVVESVGAAGRGRVVTRHLAREHVETVTVGIHEGRC